MLAQVKRSEADIMLLGLYVPCAIMLPQSLLPCARLIETGLQLG